MLSKYGIAFEERDIENDPEALQELRLLGAMTAPVTASGGRFVAGFKPEQILELFRVNCRVSLPDPAETIPLIGKTLEAVERAVRQIPDEKLGWHAAGRKRPLRELAWHVFAVAQNMIGAKDGFATLAKLEPSDYSFDRASEIADYGAGVISSYWAWAAKQDLGAQQSTSQANPTTAAASRAEHLDALAAHAVQHLRQLYWVLEDFGITPEKRLNDSEFPAEYVLPTLW